MVRKTHLKMSLSLPQLVIKSVDKVCPTSCTLNAGRTAAFAAAASNDSKRMERMVIRNEDTGDKDQPRRTSCATIYTFKQSPLGPIKQQRNIM
jgi:hypothetical protein